MAESADGDGFQKLSHRFIDWLAQNGTKISYKIELADLRQQNAGRAVLALEDIDEDEELFSIRRSSTLTVDTSTLPVDVKGIVEDPWLSLILAMVYEYQQGLDSTWRPYFDVLPQDFDTLMYWSEEELKELEGSAVVHKIGKAGADKAFTEQLIPVVRKHDSLFKATNLSVDDILQLCHRMGSTIMAYAFDVESASPTTEQDGWEEDSDAGETLPKGMVPLADMLNADADRNNSKLFYEEDRVVMKTIKPVKKGEELFNDYGPLPRADVLRRYGYITDNYAQYDVVEVALDLIKAVAVEMKIRNDDIKRRIEYLDDQGVLDDGYDISRASSEDGQFSDELKILLNVLVLPKEEFEKLQKKEKLPKTELSKNAVELLYSILAKRRAMYPPSSAPSRAIDSTDEATLVRNERRRLIAMHVIAGEKEVLREAAEAIQELLGDGKKRRPDTFEDEATKIQQSTKKPRDGAV